MDVPDPNMIVPLGTRVVTRCALPGGRPAGAVGEIVHAPLDPTHAYRLRFADGLEVALRRSRFALLRHDQRPPPPDDPLADFDLERCVIYRCIVGSRAYGLAGADSDVDRRGIYLPPAQLHWSLYGVPEQLEHAETDECYWEFQKFLTLALKANPNVLECLYTPLVEQADPLARELRAMRSAFLSKLVYQTYNGYVLSQFKKLTARLRNQGTIKWKHAMHLVRLLLAGIRTLRDGVVPVAIEAHRERLLAIREGRVPWEEVDAWRLALHAEFDAAFAASELPERPDYAAANALLLRARATAAAAARRIGVVVRPSAAGPDPAAEFADRCPTADAHHATLRRIVEEAPCPLLFATISGAHLYGFPSADSDFDLRGVHLLPAEELLGLRPGRATIEQSGLADGIELDLVTHDAGKFFRLLVKRNGYVLEQLHSPLVVHTTPEHRELREIASGLVTRRHAHHYLGFARTQWKLFGRDPRVKPLLYVYRVLLTGIHMMRTGATEANLLRLNEVFRLPYIAPLVERKLAGPEAGRLVDADLDFHAGEHARLTAELELARERSALPDTPSAEAIAALNELLVRLRLGAAVAGR